MGQLSEENKENIVKQVAACSTINLSQFRRPTCFFQVRRRTCLHQPHVFSTSTPWCSLFGFFCPDHPRNLHNNHDHQNYDHQANIFSGSRPPAVGRNLFRQAGNLIWDRDHPFQTSLLIIMSMTSAFSVNLKADAAGVGKVCVQRG